MKKGPFTLKIKGKKFNVKSLEEASSVFLKENNHAGVFGELIKGGETFAHISPNGRVWEGSDIYQQSPKKLLLETVSDSPWLNPSNTPFKYAAMTGIRKRLQNAVLAALLKEAQRDIMSGNSDDLEDISDVFEDLRGFLGEYETVSSKEYFEFYLDGFKAGLKNQAPWSTKNQIEDEARSHYEQSAEARYECLPKQIATSVARLDGYRAGASTGKYYTLNRLSSIAAIFRSNASEQKIAAVDYDSYMKEHPASKKQRNDPMFTQPEKQPAPAKPAPAPAAPSKQSPVKPQVPAAKKSVSDFSDAELDSLGFMPSYRKSFSDSEVLAEHNAKQEYEKLLQFKKIAPKDEDEMYSSYMSRSKKEKATSQSQSMSGPDFQPGDYYTAIRKHIGDSADSLTRKGIRDAVKVYHPQDRLSDDQVDRIMRMYEDKKGWG